MKGFLLTLAFLFLTFSTGFTQTAQIRQMTGRVEIKHDYSANWEIVRAGQSLNENTIISTGFRSFALIQTGSIKILVRPLTRLTLEEIRAAGGTESINISLESGRIRLEVESAAQTTASVSIQTSSMTASVGGAVFELDTINLTVTEGLAEFRGGASGVPVLIDSGRFSYADEDSRHAALPEVTALTELRPILPINSEKGLPMDTIAANVVSTFVDITVGVKF